MAQFKNSKNCLYGMDRKKSCLAFSIISNTALNFQLDVLAHLHRAAIGLK